MKKIRLSEAEKNSGFSLPGKFDHARRLLCLTLFLTIGISGFAGDTTNSPAARMDDTNSQELRTYLQLQEQLHATQLAIERTRKEAADLAAQSNEALAARLQAIEQALSAQRARELEAMQSSNQAMVSSNQTMLRVAGSFAAMGFIAMLLMGYFQWKTVNRLADLSAALPRSAWRLGPGPALPALGQGDSAQLATSPAVDEASSKFLNSVKQLEKRLEDLEHPGHPAQDAGTATEGRPAGAPNGSSDSTAATDAAKITLLLNKGQSLLNLDKAEEALTCFDGVLEIEANNPEALVKKGTALEKMRKLNEAVECYDRAIAADGTMTIAYLYKGGVFNRMEKFSEALECYEQALRTQEKRRA